MADHPTQIPGSVAVPAGPNSPWQLVVLIPQPARRTAALVALGDSQDPDAPISHIATFSETQLRNFAEASSEVADWLHEHT